jgi:hypothetical protein
MLVAHRKHCVFVSAALNAGEEFGQLFSGGQY